MSPCTEDLSKTYKSQISNVISQSLMYKELHDKICQPESPEVRDFNVSVHNSRDC